MYILHIRGRKYLFLNSLYAEYQPICHILSHYANDQISSPITCEQTHFSIDKPRDCGHANTQAELQTAMYA